jgi:hypothetical protein
LALSPLRAIGPGARKHDAPVSEVNVQIGVEVALARGRIAGMAEMREQERQIAQPDRLITVQTAATDPRVSREDQCAVLSAERECRAVWRVRDRSDVKSVPSVNSRINAPSETR